MGLSQLPVGTMPLEASLARATFMMIALADTPAVKQIYSHMGYSVPEGDSPLEPDEAMSAALLNLCEQVAIIEKANSHQQLSDDKLPEALLAAWDHRK